MTMMNLILNLLRKAGAWIWTKLGQNGSHVSDLLVPVLFVAIAAESVALFHGCNKYKEKEKTSEGLSNTISKVDEPAKRVTVKTGNGIVTGLVASPLIFTTKNIKDRMANDVVSAKIIGINPRDV